MKLLLTICFTFISLIGSFAQKQGLELIDSLKSRLGYLSEDTSKVRLLGKLSFIYYKFDTDKGIYYANEAIKLAEKLRWELGLAFSYNYLGTNYAVKGNFPKALECFNKSLIHYTAIGDKQGIAILSNNLGNFYRIQKDYSKSIEYFLKSAAINKEFNDKLNLLKNYNNLGVVYSFISDFHRSDDYYYKALKIGQEINDKEQMARIIINIADNRAKQKEYCTAFEMSFQALRSVSELNLIYDMAEYNNFIAELYLRISNEDQHTISKCRYFSYNKRQNLILSKKYCTNSIQLLEKINDLALLSDNALMLSQIYEKLGDMKMALFYYKKYSTDKDSVFSKDNSLKIAEIEKKREVELRDNQIKIQTLEIEKKNSQLISQIFLSVLFLLLAAIGLYLLYKMKTDRVKRESEESLKNSLKEKELLLKEIHHRVKNNLQIISSLLSLQSDYIKDEKSQKYFTESISRVKSMAIIHERLYQTNNFLNIDLNEYFSELTSYISGSYCVNPDRINLLLKIENMSLSLDAAIPCGLIINELIANAFEHAFPDNRKGNITLHISQIESKEYQIIIEDDGIGLPENFDSDATNSLGLLLVQSLVSQLGGKLDVFINCGTKFIITFPARIK